eukprot:gnl/TRDRNA2_/TRDRNA2_129683_c0_seq1.p1 gnl/TRDRNA2_/TRDRNA2_129683_c0~~gnl/TRDRNA2_/TRDRNA2_129683_c0_seq1.p1  ORF type:complete len:707 (+),score=94.50 gnl/TRDRNA2_/TRDRNA2_129683_c0_seq1:156-2276(+)
MRRLTVLVLLSLGTPVYPEKGRPRSEAPTRRVFNELKASMQRGLARMRPDSRGREPRRREDQEPVQRQHRRFHNFEAVAAQENRPRSGSRRPPRERRGGEREDRKRADRRQPETEGPDWPDAEELRRVRMAELGIDEKLGQQPREKSALDRLIEQYEQEGKLTKDGGWGAEDSESSDSADANKEVEADEKLQQLEMEQGKASKQRSGRRREKGAEPGDESQHSGRRRGKRRHSASDAPHSGRRRSSNNTSGADGEKKKKRRRRRHKVECNQTDEGAIEVKQEEEELPFILLDEPLVLVFFYYTQHKEHDVIDMFYGRAKYSLRGQEDPQMQGSWMRGTVASGATLRGVKRNSSWWVEPRSERHTILMAHSNELSELAAWRDMLWRKNYESRARAAAKAVADYAVTLLGFPDLVEFWANEAIETEEEITKYATSVQWMNDVFLHEIPEENRTDWNVTMPKIDKSWITKDMLTKKNRTLALPAPQAAQNASRPETVPVVAVPVAAEQRIKQVSPVDQEGLGTPTAERQPEVKEERRQGLQETPRRPPGGWKSASEEEAESSSFEHSPERIGDENGAKAQQEVAQTEASKQGSDRKDAPRCDKEPDGRRRESPKRFRSASRRRPVKSRTPPRRHAARSPGRHRGGSPEHKGSGGRSCRDRLSAPRGGQPEVSIALVALIAVCAGNGVLFVRFRIRHSTWTSGEKALLAA